jgi:hypothetical protein
MKLHYRRFWQGLVVLAGLMGGPQSASADPNGEFKVPERAIWREISISDSDQKRPTVSVQAVLDGKWRIETGHKQKPFVAVFDGRSFASSPPVPKGKLDPLYGIRMLASAVKMPVSRATVQQDGRAYTKLVYKDLLAEATLLVNPSSKYIERMWTHRIGEGIWENRYEYFPIDVSSLPESAFSVENLQSIFAKYLPDPRVSSAPR